MSHFDQLQDNISSSFQEQRSVHSKDRDDKVQKELDHTSFVQAAQQDAPIQKYRFYNPSTMLVVVSAPPDDRTK